VQDLTLAYRIMAKPLASDPIQALFAPSIPPAPAAKRYIGIYRAWWDQADSRVLKVCNDAICWFAAQHYEVIPIYIPLVDVGQLAHSGACLAEMANTARSRSNNPSDNLTSPATQLLLTIGAQTPAGDLFKYAALRELLMQHLAHLFQSHPGLLIVTPTTAVNGWPKHAGDDAVGLSDGNATIRAMTYVWLANSTGCPAVSVPVGYAQPAVGSGRLPVSLMAMGEWGAEEQLLAWSGEAETYLNEVVEGGRVRPDQWVDVIQLAQDKK